MVGFSSLFFGCTRADTFNGRSSSRDFNCGYHPNVSDLLQVRGLKVELPTPAGWIRPVNDVSLRIAAGESLGLVPAGIRR